MKKLYTMCSSLFIMLFALIAWTPLNAQNLVSNGSFEQWTDGKPDGWSVAGSYEDSNIAFEGDHSFRQNAPKSSNNKLTQKFDMLPNTKYKLTVNYYTDTESVRGRIWANFLNGTQVVNLVAKDTEDPLRTYNGYFTAEANTWKVYEVEFTSPDNIDAFNFEIRTYSGANYILYDGLSVVPVETTDEPVVNVSPASVDFSNVLINTEEKHNISIFGANLTAGLTIAVEGNGFSIDKTSLTKEEVEAGAQVELTFAPQTVGSYAGKVIVSGADLSEAKEIALTGEAIVPVVYGTLAELLTKKDEEGVYEMTGDVTVAFVSGKYIYVEDATATMLVYATNTLSKGDVISGLNGTFTKYKGLHEFEPLSEDDLVASSTSTTFKTPEVKTIGDIATEEGYAAYESVLVTITNVKYLAGEFSASAKKGVFVTADGHEVEVYDQFRAVGTWAPDQEATYNVTGYVARYDSKIQLFPRSAEDAGYSETPEVIVCDELLDLVSYKNDKDAQFKVAGNVTVAFAADPYFYLEDESANVMVYLRNWGLSKGDVIKNLEGKWDSFSGLNQFVATSYELVGTSEDYREPREVTLADILADYDNYESVLVKVVGVTFGSGSFSSEKKQGIDMTQGGATMKCYDTHLSVGDWTPSDNEYTVTGYVSKYNTPQLAPRSADDLAVIQGIGSSKEDAFSIRTGSNLIVISSDKDAAVEIYNALGQMVKHAALKAGETTVSIAKGMYIVKVMDKTTKVIVK